MPSRTIRPTQAPEPAPFTYTVGTAEGLAPQAVTAQWDGTGAGGDFLPCVSFYNAEGVLLDRAFPTTGAVTAGGTAEVSYRPFDRGGGGASGTTLTVEDNTTVVTPADTLFAFDPFVVTNLGGTIAGLGFAPAYAFGGLNTGSPVNVTTPQTLAMTTTASRLFTLTGTSWTFTLAGTYLIGILANFSKVGPLAAGTSMAVTLTNTHAGRSCGVAQQPAPAIPAGQTFNAGLGGSRLIQASVGDTLSIVANSNVGGTVFSVLSALGYALFLFP